jgi:hypothetical protein
MLEHFEKERTRGRFSTLDLEFQLVFWNLHRERTDRSRPDDGVTSLFASQPDQGLLTPSIVPQGHRWIDLQGPLGGNVAGEQRDQDQRRRRGHQRDGIIGRHADEL